MPHAEQGRYDETGEHTILEYAGNAWHACVSLAGERQLQHVAHRGCGHVSIALAQLLVAQRMLVACAPRPQGLAASQGMTFCS